MYGLFRGFRYFDNPFRGQFEFSEYFPSTILEG